MASSPSLPLDIAEQQGVDQTVKSTASFTKTGQTPPYWTRDRRTVSNISYTSVLNGPRPPPIVLEDRTEEVQQESSDGLWARSVCIDEYVVVTGSSVGAGSFVVWICKVAMLDGTKLEIRKRYSEFDRLRTRLVTTFPHSRSAIPLLPPKSVVSKLRPRFLSRRREGLDQFLNFIILNPEFASSPALKDFIFS